MQVSTDRIRASQHPTRSRAILNVLNILLIFFPKRLSRSTQSFYNSRRVRYLPAK